MAFTCHFFHIVFSTKDRRPWLQDDLAERACKYMGGIARNLKAQIILGNGMPDHVHLFSLLPPTLTVPDFVGKIKANCSGWIHDTLPALRGFAWQDSYASFTVSPSVVPRVKKYVAEQQTHHRKFSFETELIALLKKHGIQYDERYLWR